MNTRNVKCDIVCDLLPLYLEGLASKESREYVENHMETCKECQRTYRDMSSQVWIFPLKSSGQEKKSLLQKWKKYIRSHRVYFMIGIIIILYILLWFAIFVIIMMQGGLI